MDRSSEAMKSYTSLPGDESTLDDSNVYALLRDAEGRLWVGTAEGLNLYDPHTDSFRRVRSLGVSVACLAQDAKGNIWMGTNGSGAFRYNPKADVWKNFRYIPGDSALPHNHVNHLLPGSDGTLWAATTNGLARFDSASDRFQCIPPPDRGTTTELTALAEADGILWISSAHGIVRYDPALHQARTLTEAEGLPSDQFMPGAIATAPDGRIYMGTANGACAFYPRKMLTNTFVPPVQVSEIEVDGREVSVTSPLKIGPDARSLTLRLAALSFVNPAANRFRYRLEGYDDQWHETSGADPTVTYTNLPAGSYTLQVEGANSDGVWNPAATSLRIVVSPPWWASWWMKMVYALLFIALLVLVGWRINLRASQRRRREIARLRAGREKEIAESKLQFFTIIAHEIRTPVSLIIGPLEKVMASRTQLGPAARRDMDIIDRNAHRLLSLVNQLLDFKKVEQGALAITFRPVPVVAQVKTVAERFAPSVEQQGGTLVCNYPQEDFIADVDPEALKKLVSNLLNNARKFMRSQIVLTVAQQPDRGTFTVTVRDDGCGIAPENLKKIFKPFFQVADASTRADAKGGTGLGLSIVRRVAEAHHGTVEVASQVDTYTLFTATLPLRQENAFATADEPATLPTSEAILPATSTSANATALEPNAATRPRVLVVDDNPEMTAFLAEALADTYQVDTAPDGRMALEKLRASADAPFSLIVSDWMMPELDGMQLLRAVRADMSLSHIPFVLLTAKTDNLSHIQGLDSGADYYVEKPFSTSFLRACIANLVRRRRQAAQRYASEPLETVKAIAPNPTDDRFLQRLTTLIEERLTDDDLSVDLLAQEMGMSRSAFYAKIRSLAGTSPGELIELTRLKRAARLLVQGRYMVAEVATLVGYNSASYFSTRFKAQFGTTPAAFAAKN